jgi:hypothetical protein
VSTVRRRTAAAALAVTALLGVSACGTSFDAQTNKIYQPGVGANHRGEVDVLGTLLVVNEDKSATISAGLINNSGAAQDLSSVTATTLADKTLPVRGQKVKLPLPDNRLATLGGASDAGGWQVTNGVTAGGYVRLTFTFSDSAPVTIEAPVVARTSEYASVSGVAPSTSADGAKQDNTDITVSDAAFVIDGEKAYLNATIESTLDQADHAKPTAEDADGKALNIKSQSSTGGPADVIAPPGGSLDLTGSATSGDGLYIDASAVTAGDKVTVTFPFESGDVVVEATIRDS